MILRRSSRVVPVLLTIALAACGGDPDETGAGGAGGAGIPEDSFCPDPDDPRVHYQSQDPNACIGGTLDCTSEQNGFQNACGCGCIDKGDPLCPTPTDPNILWIGYDAATCGEGPPSCALGDTPFNNSCGCGCIQH